MAAHDPQAIAELYRDIFLTDVRGRAVLEHLTNRFCKSKAVETEGGIDAVLKTYQRAAHREVLDFIHLQIARAEMQGQPQETDDA